MNYSALGKVYLEVFSVCILRNSEQITIISLDKSRNRISNLIRELRCGMPSEQNVIQMNLKWLSHISTSVIFCATGALDVCVYSLPNLLSLSFVVVLCLFMVIICFSSLSAYHSNDANILKHFTLSVQDVKGLHNVLRLQQRTSVWTEGNHTVHCCDPPDNWGLESSQAAWPSVVCKHQAFPLRGIQVSTTQSVNLSSPQFSWLPLLHGESHSTSIQFVVGQARIDLGEGKIEQRHTAQTE